MSINITYMQKDVIQKVQRIVPVSSAQSVHHNLLKNECNNKKKGKSSGFQELLDQSIEELEKNDQKTI